MLPLRSILVAFATAACPAQAPSAWTCVDVPGSSATAFAVLWGAGYDDDDPAECGAARAIAECRLERARAAVPGVMASGIQVVGDATVAFALVAAANWRDGLRFCEALVDDARPLGDDLVAGALARAALLADDGEWHYPGEVLQSRARLALFAGTAAGRPVAGSASAVQRLGPARLRELLLRPVAASCLCLGALPSDLRLAAARWPVRSVALASPPRPPAARPPLPHPPEFVPHSRVDGPFVAVAYAVPEAVSRAALAVGVEVARARAARSLRLRGGESRARAPIVGWSWLHGDPLVIFLRRGVNGGSAAAAAAELEHLLADLRARPPAPEELAGAKAALQQELALTPGAGAMLAALQDPAALPGRAMVLSLAAHRGIQGAAVAAVTVESAHAALVQTCPADGGWWGGLVPSGAAPLAPSSAR